MESRPGKYWEYARCFFPDEESITTKGTSFSLGESKVGSHSEPDPNECMVKIKGHWLEDKSLELALSDVGTFLRGHATTENRTIETGLAIMKSVGAVASGVVPLGPATPFEEKTDEPKELVEFISRHPSRSACISKEKTAHYEANKRKYDTEAEKFGEDYPSLQEAYRAYKGLHEMLVRRQTHILGGASTQALVSLGESADAFKVRLDEIDKLIAKYKNHYFLGETVLTPTSLDYEYSPPESEGPPFELYNFSTNCGVRLTKKDQGFRDVSQALISKHCPTGRNDCEERDKVHCSPEGETTVSLRLTMLASGLLARMRDDTKEDDKAERGFYYRVPSIALVTICDGKREIYRSRLPIAQRGITASLPASTGGRKTSYTVDLNDETGALENFILGSSGLIESSMVTDAGTIAGTILDSRAKAQQASAARASASTDRAHAIRLREILENCAAIKAAQEALGGPIKLPAYCQQ